MLKCKLAGMSKMKVNVKSPRPPLTVQLALPFPYRYIPHDSYPVEATDARCKLLLQRFVNLERITAKINTEGAHVPVVEYTTIITTVLFPKTFLMIKMIGLVSFYK